MEKYISVNKLMEEVKEMHRRVSSVNTDYDTGFHSATSAMQGLIAAMPKEYFPDVILCKDCAAYHPYGKGTEELVCWGKCMKISMDVDMPANGFCCFSDRLQKVESGLTVEITGMTQEDFDRFDGCGMDGFSCLAGRYKLVVHDRLGHEGITYMEIAEFDKLGLEYIRNHAVLEYSEMCKEWFVKISQNDFHNNPEKNPPKCVTVRFIEMKCGENTEVWQDAYSGKYYLRMLCNEPFSRWMTCGGRSTGWLDRNEVRPNVTFMNAANGEIETVRYNDWNGTAAYSDTFNPNFRKEPTR